MIPFSQLTAETIRANMLITTPHELAVLFITYTVCVILYFMLLMYLDERKWKKFLKHYSLEMKYEAWREERKRWI